MVLRADSSRRPTRASRFAVKESALSMMVGSARPRRHVDDLELDPVRVLEKHRVVAWGILGELARRAVERREASRHNEPLVYPVHLQARVDAEGELIQPLQLSKEAAATKTR